MSSMDGSEAEPAAGGVIPPTDARWSAEFIRYYGDLFGIRVTL